MIVLKMLRKHRLVHAVEMNLLVFRNGTVWPECQYGPKRPGQHGFGEVIAQYAVSMLALKLPKVPPVAELGRRYHPFPSLGYDLEILGHSVSAVHGFEKEDEEEVHTSRADDGTVFHYRRDMVEEQVKGGQWRKRPVCHLFVTEAREAEAKPFFWQAKPVAVIRDAYDYVAERMEADGFQMKRQWLPQPDRIADVA